MEREEGTEAEEIILEMDGEEGGSDGREVAPEGPHLDELKISLVTNTEALDRIQTSQQKMISGEQLHQALLLFSSCLRSHYSQRSLHSEEISLE